MNQESCDSRGDRPRPRTIGISRMAPSPKKTLNGPPRNETGPSLGLGPIRIRRGDRGGNSEERSPLAILNQNLMLVQLTA